MTEELDFESALKRLEEKVELLGEGKLSLDEALKEFEEGIRLYRFCSERLQEAEQRVKVLVEREGGMVEEPFQQEEE
jgi:exodeoxyribonuclease VII small subunit